MSVRDDVTQVALSVVGMGAKDDPPGRKQDYINLVAKGETPIMQSAMCTMSGCALVVAGIWKRAGLKHPKLSPPYKIGSAVARLYQVALEKHAWKPYNKNVAPMPGDMIMVGNNTATGGIEHVATITSIRISEDSGELVLESVDGGQRDASNQQIILAKQRVWRFGRDVCFEGTDPGSRLMGGRAIVGIVDIESLFAN